jgi:hypothetical protein
MAPSGVSSPTDTTEGPQHGGRCGNDSGGGTVDISGGICGRGSDGGTVDISGGRGGGGGSGCDSGDDKPESVPAAASVGGSSSKRVVLDLPPPR